MLLVDVFDDCDFFVDCTYDISLLAVEKKRHLVLYQIYVMCVLSLSIGCFRNAHRNVPLNNLHSMPDHPLRLVPTVKLLLYFGYFGNVPPTSK